MGTSRETGCADALYVAQIQAKMLSAWLGRNGHDGKGGSYPIYIGLDDENAAYYDDNGERSVGIGYNSRGKWMSSLDMVGHEMAHGIDELAPGGFSESGTGEFVADVFGAATEAYANNPKDPFDYEIFEALEPDTASDLRYMYKPSKDGASPDSYPSAS